MDNVHNALETALCTLFVILCTKDTQRNCIFAKNFSISLNTMRKTLLPLLVSMASVCVQADLYEDFNSLTTGSWSAATEVSLPSGTWTFGSGAQYNKSNNVISIKLNANGAYMITPPTDSIQTLSFAYRTGGSNKKVVISYAAASDNWTVLDTLKIVSSSSNFSTYSKRIPCDSLQGIRIRLTGLTSNVYIDDVRLSQPKADQGGGGGGGVVIPGEPDPDYTRPIFTATRNTYYISPEGNDLTGDGSFEKPWFNPAKAVAVAQAGDVIFARGGRYLISMRGTDNKLTIRLTQSGTAEEPIVISAYENEVPVFDFEQQLLDCNRNKANVGDRGMLITGNYWILFGLHLMHAADNAIKLEGSHNRIERCEFSYNLDTGIQLGFGHDFSASGLGSKNDGSFCAYNDIIDCDSHHNCNFDMRDMGPYELPQEDNTTGIQQITTPDAGASLGVRQEVNGEEIVVFSVPRDGRGSLKVLDISGRLLQQVDLGILVSGMTYFQPIAAPMGMHIIVLQTDDGCTAVSHIAQ